jgi:hypothetical protein
MKLDMYTTAPEPISTAYFIDRVHQSVSVCVSPIIAWQRLGRHVPAATNTHNRRFVGGVVFLMVCIISNKCQWVSLCIPLSLLGNGALNMIQRQRGIVGGVTFYVVCVVLKNCRLLVLLRTSCILYVIVTPMYLH